MDLLDQELFKLHRQVLLHQLDLLDQELLKLHRQVLFHQLDRSDQELLKLPRQVLFHQLVLLVLLLHLLRLILEYLEVRLHPLLLLHRSALEFLPRLPILVALPDRSAL